MKTFLGSLLIGLFGFGFANAQDTSKNKLSSTVLGVLTQKPDTTKAVRNGVAYAGDVIKITISNPQTFLESKPQDKSKLLLFIDGLPFSGISCTYFDQYSKQDIKNKTFTLPKSINIPFVLLRNADTKTTWDYLYRKSDFFDRTITVEASVGWEGMFPLEVDPKADNKFAVVFFYNYEVLIVLVIYILIIAYFVYLASTTNMLRDYPPTVPPGSPPPPLFPTVGPYSLSQTQLAFWTILIVGGFIYTVVLTDISDSFNPSILLLLGVSISTTGVASYIDYYKKNTSTITMVPKPKSKFLKDILSDGSTYSVQRIQTAVWNLVLGLFFIYYTINNKTMPTFPDTLLYLAGFSSIAYVVSKRTENVT